MGISLQGAGFVIKGKSILPFIVGSALQKYLDCIVIDCSWLYTGTVVLQMPSTKYSTVNPVGGGNATRDPLVVVVPLHTLSVSLRTGGGGNVDKSNPELEQNCENALGVGQAKKNNPSNRNLVNRWHILQKFWSELISRSNKSVVG